MPEGRTDWERVRSMTEEEIEANAASDPDNPPLTEEQLASGRWVRPEEFRLGGGAIPIDEDVLTYFARKGPDYIEEMNEILRDYARGCLTRA
jgi:uncharacterized protein (DUF4415 family)